MEEDKSGLKILISQRLQRPKLSRVISWEIEKERTSEISSKQRRKVKKKLSSQDSSVEDTHCAGSHGDSKSESDGLEYYSAEEYFISSDSESSTSSPPVSLIDLDLDDESADDEDDGCLDRKRAPSKKQKRRRRKRNKLCYADYNIPFRNVEHIDLDASDLFEFCPTSIHVNRVVPSLFQLAMHTVWKQRKSGAQSLTKLPSIVKHVVFDWQHGQSFASIQLSFLYRILAYAEKNLSLFADVQYDDFKKLTTYEIVLKKRNIWSPAHSFHHDFEGHQHTAWLPFTYFGLWKIYETTAAKCLYPAGLISILSVVMDLMLPRNISTVRYNKYRKQTRSEADAVRKATQSLLDFVKDSLRKRYPEVIKVFFDWAVPYFHWSRGNIQCAVEAFFKNSDKVSGIRRASLLSEAARLYSQHDEANMAAHLHMEAANAVVEDIKRDDDVVNQIAAQRFALMADVYDQGPMTSVKAEEAASAWKAALQHAKHNQTEMLSRSIESLLCFHSGSHQGVSDFDILKEAINLASLDVTRFHLHLSLMHALLGNRSESFIEYRRFKQNYYSSEPVPGSFMIVKGAKETFHPWQHVLEHTEAGSTVSLLRVAWRTQLGSMRIVTGLHSFDGDFASHPNLHLNMTSDGFLSADLQMVLPSIRNLKLDPYTGLPVYDQLSRVNFAWHSLDFLSKEIRNYDGRFLTPTPVEIYNSGGNHVHILCPDSSLLLLDKSYLNTFITLYWTGTGLERAKLNLFSHLRKAFHKQKIQHYSSDKSKMFKTMNDNWYMKYMDSDELHTTMLKALQICFDRGWAYDIFMVTRVMEGIQNAENLKKSKEQEKNKTSKKVKSHKVKYPYNSLRHGEPSQFCVQLKTYFSYHSTIFMLFETSDGSSCVAFIDCTTKENFINPRLIVDSDIVYQNDDFSESKTLPRVERHILPGAQIMWHGVRYMNTADSSNIRVCYIYGQKGELLKTTYPSHDEIAGANTYTKTPVVYGRKMYGVAEDELSIMCDDLSGPLTFSDPLPKIRSLSVIVDKLMVTTEQGLYILDPDALQVCPIIVECASSLQISDEHHCILNVSDVQIVGKKLITEDTDCTTRMALATNNHLMVLDFAQSVKMQMCVAVAGLPKEVCFLGKKSLLASCTLHKGCSDYYREHIFHLSYSGQLLGVLPFLGPGPRCFLPVFLSACEDSSTVESHLGQPGWRIFMRDGHEGIMAISVEYL